MIFLFPSMQAARVAKAAMIAQADYVEAMRQEAKRTRALAETFEGGRYSHHWMATHYIADPKRHGFRYDPACDYWIRDRLGQVEVLMADPPLPFFLDPEQIRELAPDIDWDRRVGDRIRHFLTMHQSRQEVTYAASSNS